MKCTTSLTSFLLRFQHTLIKEQEGQAEAQMELTKLKIELASAKSIKISLRGELNSSKDEVAHLVKKLENSENHLSKILDELASSKRESMEWQTAGESADKDIQTSVFLLLKRYNFCLKIKVFE